MKTANSMLRIACAVVLTLPWISVSHSAGEQRERLDAEQESAQAVVAAYHESLMAGDHKTARKTLSHEFTMFNGNFSDDPTRWQAHNYMTGIALDAWPKDFVTFAGPYVNDYEFVSTHTRGDAAIVVTTETGSNKFRAWNDETVVYLLGRREDGWKITSLFIRDIKNPE